MFMKLSHNFGVHSARQFANVNKHLPQHLWDYENYTIQYGYPTNTQFDRFQDDYELFSKVGRGKYSEVFQGINVITNREVVVKVLKPNVQKKFQREILILKRLNNHPNIVQLYDVVKDAPTNIISLVFEKLDNINLVASVKTLTLKNIRHIMFEVLKGLQYAHSQGIFHRDLKPQNIMVDSAMQVVKIIDWGLAEFYHDEKDYNVRVASRYFKPPEILVDFHFYNYSFDTWSLGAIFGGMIFRREPLIVGKTPDDQLIQTLRLLGTDDFNKYMRKYDFEIPNRYVLKSFPKLPFKTLINQKNSDLCSDDALDLLEKMLVYDHIERPTIEELLHHPFFSNQSK